VSAELVFNELRINVKPEVFDKASAAKAGSTAPATLERTMAMKVIETITTPIKSRTMPNQLRGMLVSSLLESCSLPGDVFLDVKVSRINVYLESVQTDELLGQVVRTNDGSTSYTEGYYKGHERMYVTYTRSLKSARRLELWTTTPVAVLRLKLIDSTFARIDRGQ
jgi:hypothetical protein